MNPRITKRRKEVKAYVKDNWETLASMAWEGFEKHGRGFLLLDSLPSSLLPPNFAYANPNMLASPDKKDSRVVKTLEELVGTYDPKTEVVIVFWPANEELVYWYVSSHQPPPPEAVNHGALKLPDLPN